MPCVFTRSRIGGQDWRSLNNRLRPSMNERFNILTALRGGGCGYCGNTIRGVAWGSNQYVLCLDCAPTFGAPDLRRTDPDLFPEEIDENTVNEDPEITVLITKRDKDFKPHNYRLRQWEEPLSGRNGCAGYKCETYPAPDRTIPANTQFMSESNGSRGNLCMACFAKLKAKYDALPGRQCDYCGNKTKSTLVEVSASDCTLVCPTCVRGSFLHAPETDCRPIRVDEAVYITRGSGRVYASHFWAQHNWFQGQDGEWYETQREQDRARYGANARYISDHLAQNHGSTLFHYGTNVIRMLGFPEVTPIDSLCFGVELEMQPNQNHVHTEVVDALGGKWIADRPYILCRDSSLGSEGVEMITLPYTLANHKSDKYIQWTKILQALRKVAKSGKDTTQCGMHVHINRKALSHLTLGKMLIVINAPEMQELIATIAQRGAISYTRRFYKKVTEGGKIIGSHVDALNISGNKGTAELRIFRGNLRYERVMKNLEFAEALCLYAGEQSIQRVHEPEQLVEWILSHRGQYPELSKFIREFYKPTEEHKVRAAYARATRVWEHAATIPIESIEGDI